VFELRDFPDDVLFWQTATRLIEMMRQEGLEPEVPPGLSDLDPVDRAIIETVHKIEDREKLKATDELVALRLPVMSPQTGVPYTRETINKRRNKLRGKGYNV